MSQSPLVDYAAYTTCNCSVPRAEKISKITVHHMAGVMSVEAMGATIHNPNREVSCNYAIGWDARVGGYIKEENRSWCSSSPWNDHKAITIEVSNSACSSDWPVSDKVWAKLVDLCADICKRNGIPKLTYTGNSSGTLTFHCFFSATACLPIDRTELLTPNGWKYLSDITVNDKIATVQMDTLGIVFDKPLGIIPKKIQDTYTVRDFEATSDHRILYSNQPGRKYVREFKDVYDLPGSQVYFYNAGRLENPTGLDDLSPNEIELLVAVQADGHYMRDGLCRYGIEFHFRKERKIRRVENLLFDMGIDYTKSEQSDGSTKIRIYGKEYVEWCEKYLYDKCFTWDWININEEQADRFFEAILQYDGCEANNSYSSLQLINCNVVQAIAALNGIGSKMSKERTRVYFKNEKRTLGENVRKRNPRQEVSCVTVRSGFILIRQHGRTTITGNCPGPYIKNRAQLLCDQVNAKLNGSTVPEVKPTDPKTDPTVVVNVKVGDIVSISSNAVYWSGTSIPGWVKNLKWKISDIKNNRAILGSSEDGVYNIQSPIDVKFLNIVKSSTQMISEQVKISAGTPIYLEQCTEKCDTVKSTGIYTIIEKKNVNGTSFGKLKSGAGWINLNNLTKTIVKGSKVKVLKNIQYNGNSFKQYQDVYTVLEISGDRVVISSDGKNVTCAINISNLELV